jgi:hypothetical protein
MNAVNNKVFRVRATHDGVPAVKTKVASFFGGAHMAERGDDGDLHIYKVSTENEPMNTVGDKRQTADTRGADVMARMFEGAEKARQALEHACGCGKK